MVRASCAALLERMWRKIWYMRKENPSEITRLVMANNCLGCLGLGWEMGMQNWAESHFGATACGAHHWCVGWGEER